MDLQALSDFDLVAANGGFGRAARVSGRSKATLSRRVSELEESLGVRLIERGSQNLRLTDEGRALHERTHGLLSEIAEAGEAVVLGASTPKGRLRVSAPMVFAHVALPRIAARFALAYPEVQLEIVAEDRKVDPVEDGYDLIIRIDPSPDERLVGRRFLNDERLIVAPPGMVRPFPGVNGEESTVKAILLSATPAGTVWRISSETEADIVLRPDPVLRLSSLLMVRDAVLAGAGAAMLPKLLVAGDIEAGRLAYWGKQAGPPVEIWALQSSRRLVGAKVRAFLEVVGKAFPEKAFVAPGV
ncbi:LysR family transcriptional regulator [Agrobacterium rosae]|uniref:LysR family transcriptional regulator n=1 Tax=Agrobacterium rosae TaxID=1972867 RepID=A0AAE5S0N9_9HYPH|nr:LysR family transcriptional regulator [Agrobacterium rosae]KAA3512885.1 LysR family transcriptional regulator [Agrobacterium rosae]KAA3521627.1 LysR family transcriptional regulator [Agrobacterium rosae]MCM2432486.1 LysR family transcriptional regulator [Agrobacterium rosae]MDX8328443.1 LysR family transcriptional regulator [Agrobacterium rosae]MQB48560.1 LysR family transcriptional regulator [Agrobacterium rosae]